MVVATHRRLHTSAASVERGRRREGVVTSSPLPPTVPPDTAGDFVGAELAEHPERYTVIVQDTERRALVALESELTRIADGTWGDAPGEPATSARARAVEARLHQVLAAQLEACRRLLSTGYGFVWLRGLPTDLLSPAASARLYTLLGRGLGEPVPQNLRGELITHVRDAGADPNDPEVRRYRTRAEQDFHTDGADVIGLLCLSAAAKGGESRLLSSVRVYRRVLAERPDLAPLLEAPWHFHLPGARARGLPPTIERPIVTRRGDKVETFYIGWYLDQAQALDGVPPLDGPRRELLALYRRTLADSTLHLSMQLAPGDVQWLRNAYILHARAAYEDGPPPVPPRHLLRLWLSAPQLDDRTPRFPASTGGGA
jgi:hypothetical protein